MAPPKGFVPWNKGMKGRKPWHNTKGLIPAKKGNTLGFKKGVIPKTAFKKGHKTWNYIDGRSKTQPWNRYGTDWKKIREKVLIRDNKQCQICGKFEGRLEIHHKKPFLMSGDNSMSNLVTLCAHCHRIVESEITGRLIKMKISEGLPQEQETKQWRKNGNRNSFRIENRRDCMDETIF